MNSTPDASEPEDLTGGNSNIVQRVGDRVRRTAGPWTPTIHKFLAILRAKGISEVPEPFGLDREGREILSFIPGTVANYPVPEWVWSDAILKEASTLLRRMHDATVDTLFDDAIWQTPSHQPQQVICHNDFAPYNMVFDQTHLVGVIDFDTASPGPRVWDFAYMAYRLVPFGEFSGPAVPPSQARMSRLKAAIQAYGILFEPREVLDVMAVRLEDLAAYTDTRAALTGNSDFTQHAALYRRDATQIRALATAELQSDG